MDQQRSGRQFRNLIAISALAAALSYPAMAAELFQWQGKLPAQGQQQTTVKVPTFGRYALTVTSAQGTALQWVDRMAGPGERVGTPGEQDGRLDLFLDEGDYKLLTFSDPKGSGSATVSARAFRELHPDPAPQLAEFRTVQAALDDFEQRSYWIELKSPRTVALEAAGRNLADLRIWKDGNWLVDAQPVAEVTEPSPGKPLSSRLLAVSLEPGLYRVTAYGGPAQPWAETSKEHPFYLRYGIPSLGEAGRQRYTASPFGIDRFRIPGGADYFRLELSTAENASIRARRYDEANPFTDYGDTASISKETNPPVAELRSGAGSDERLLVVRREAGKPYLLQHFRARRSVDLSPGQYWISSLHSGHGEDYIDATGILTASSGARHRVVASAAIKLDSDRGWQRRFNLLDPSTLFFEVQSSGSYTFAVSGLDADLRVEPFFVGMPPRGYSPPPFERNKFTRSLDAGLHVLTLRPVSKGIVTLSAGPGGWITRWINKPEQITRASIGVRFGAIQIGSDSLYRLTLNDQPGVTAGIVVRALPVDLSRPLPVAQEAGEKVSTRITIPEAGTLRALSDDGRSLAFALDGKAASQEAVPTPGVHEFTLTNTTDHAVSYVLEFLPERLNSSRPLPPISAEALGSIPKFPTLDARSPHFLDLAAGQSSTMNVNVGEPALYRVESTGLLQTEGNLRTRTITSLHRSSANGVGRNFLIADYLRQGDYQLSIKPQGKSVGHLGVQLERTRLSDGGELLDGIPARATLKAGDGLLYRFHVAKAGDYRIEALGLGKRFRIRIEDKAGWPLLRPGITGDLTQRLEPGEYRLVVLPESVDARVVTRFLREEALPHFTGHGPHRIELGTTVSHLWMEPAGKGERVPDAWTFSVPAEIRALITVSAEMEGTLTKGNAEIAAIAGGAPAEIKLSPGDYRLALKSTRPNNRLGYELSLQSVELVAGQTRMVQLPADIPVAVGAGGPAELSSFGDQDVSARLYDTADQPVAGGDDQPDDWNFLLAQQLPPGRYRLRVEAVGNDGGTTAITLRVPKEQQESPLTLPAKVTLRDSALHYYPLEQVNKELLVVSVSSPETVGLAVERKSGNEWRAMGEQVGVNPLLAVPAGHARGQNYRLRIGSISHQGRPIQVQVAQVSASATGEKQLASGLALAPVEAIAPAVGVARVELDGPGMLALEEQAGAVELHYGTREGVALGVTDQGRLAASGNTLWLAGRRTQVKAARLTLSAQPLALSLASGAPAVIDVAAPEQGNQLILATSPISRPGMKLLSARGMGAVGIDRNSSVLVRHGARPVKVELWDTAASSTALPLTLRSFSFASPQPVELREGEFDGRVGASSAQAYTLPGNGKVLRLAIPAGMAAELRRGEEALDTFWAGEQPRTFRAESEADSLWLYNTRPETAQVSIEVEKSESGGALGSSRLVRFHRAAAETLRLNIRLDEREKGVGRRLHLLGNELSATAVEASGRILQGSDLLLKDDASLLIAHAPGFLLAWLSDEAGTTAIESAATRSVSLPARVSLEKESVGLKVNMAKAGALLLGSDVPAIVRVRRAGGGERVALFDNGIDLPLYLPAGENVVAIHSLTGAPLSGQATLRAVAVDSLGEGLGAKRLLAPGDSRLYRFELKSPATIGLGARASADIVSCVLLDSGGRELGRGLVQMHELAPGDYLLRIDVPADGDTVEVQPALVGVKPRDVGPPQEVIRQYMEEAGLAPK